MAEDLAWAEGDCLMGTKNNPREFDCYKSAEDDEPMFVLLGRDPDAPALVREWARLREQRGENPRKVEEARQCAENMELFLEFRRGV